MLFPYRNGREAKRIPPPVQEYMRRRFMLRWEYINQLRCLENAGVVNDTPVTLLRVFSPLQARREHLALRAYKDLDGYPELLLFEGYIDNQGNAYFRDRRTMSYVVQTPTHQPPQDPHQPRRS